MSLRREMSYIMEHHGTSSLPRLVGAPQVRARNRGNTNTVFKFLGSRIRRDSEIAILPLWCSSRTQWMGWRSLISLYCWSRAVAGLRAPSLACQLEEQAILRHMNVSDKPATPKLTISLISLPSSGLKITEPPQIRHHMQQRYPL